MCAWLGSGLCWDVSKFFFKSPVSVLSFGLFFSYQSYFVIYLPQM